MNITIFQLIFLRSGTEEQYGEIEQLLDDISAFLDDMHKTTTTKKRKRNWIERVQKCFEMLPWFP